MSKDQELEVSVTGKMLVIKIGIETLKFASEEEEGGPLEAGLTVNNTTQWAHDVAAAMEDEEQDETSPLHKFLDQMILKAAETSEALG